MRGESDLFKPRLYYGWNISVERCGSGGNSVRGCAYRAIETDGDDALKSPPRNGEGALMQAYANIKEMVRLKNAAEEEQCPKP